MALRSRLSGISIVLALAGLLVSLSAGCLCEGMRSADGSMPSMQCHTETAGARLTSPCCCDIAPQVPAVVESLRAPYLPERPALSGLPAIVRIAFAPPGRNEPGREDLGSIDRSPPATFASPLRI